MEFAGTVEEAYAPDPGRRSSLLTRGPAGPVGAREVTVR
jgi:hypothetical protein